MLADTVESAPPTILGGARTAHRLEALLKQVDRALNSVEHGTKVKASLRKGRHALNSFETLVHSGLKRKRGAIEPAIGQLILELAADTTTTFAEMQTRVR